MSSLSERYSARICNVGAGGRRVLRLLTAPRSNHRSGAFFVVRAYRCYTPGVAPRAFFNEQGGSNASNPNVSPANYGAHPVRGKNPMYSVNKHILRSK